jgi:hypothetical protein
MCWLTGAHPWTRQPALALHPHSCNLIPRSQQLQRVETMYRSRVEAIKEDCREKLATQEAAARARLADAQAAAAQMTAGVKRAAVREVQRVEALLEGKVGAVGARKGGVRGDGHAVVDLRGEQTGGAGGRPQLRTHPRRTGGEW